jgi:hypothetical protein
MYIGLVAIPSVVVLIPFITTNCEHKKPQPEPEPVPSDLSLNAETYHSNDYNHGVLLNKEISFDT